MISNTISNLFEKIENKLHTSYVKVNVHIEHYIASNEWKSDAEVLEIQLIYECEFTVTLVWSYRSCLMADSCFLLT